MGRLGQGGVLLGAVIVLFALEAGAAPGEDVARKYFEIGQTLYAQSDYEGAIRHFKESYRLSGKPELLYNIARSHEALGQYEEAIKVYEQYLATRPREGAEQVRARIANMRRLSERQRALRQEEERRQREARESEKPRGTSLPGWISIGVGGALLTTGAVFAGLARTRQSQVQDRIAEGVDYASYSSLDTQGRNYRTASIVTFAAGGAVAATGVVLLVLRALKPRHQRETAWVAPTLDSRGAGVAAGFRY